MQDHIDNYPYPVYPQAAPSFGLALQVVTGQAADMPLNCKIKTIHTVVSFATGQLFPCEHDHEMMSAAPDADLLALSQWAEPGVSPATEMRGINWKSLIVKLLPLLLALLSENE